MKALLRHLGLIASSLSIASITKFQQRFSWIASVLLHIIIILLLVVNGIFKTSPLNPSEIVEVSAIGGSSASSSTAGTATSAPEVSPTITKDAILEHSNTSKVKVSYEQLRELPAEQETVPNPTEESQPKATSSQHNTSSATNTNGGGAGTATGNNQGNGHSDKGGAEGNGTNPNGSPNGSSLGDTTDYDQVYEHPDVAPVPTKIVNPVFPEDASDDGVSGGTTRLSVIVAKDGSIESVSVSHSAGDRRFDNAAVRAMRQWRFSPAKLHGKHVRARITKAFRFDNPNF